MSIAKKATRHAIILMTSYILSMLIGIVSVLCYTRMFDPLELAIIPILQLISALCYNICNFGLGLYVQRRMPELDASDSVKAMELGRDFSMITGIGLLCCSFIIWLLSDLISSVFLKDPNRGADIVLLIPAIVFTSWNQVVLQIIRGRGLFIDMSIYSIVAQVVHLPVVIGLYVWFGVKGMILGLAVAMCLGSLFMSWRLRKYMFGRISLAAFCRFVKDALPFYGEGYVGYLIAFADQWIVAVLMTPVDLATYYVPKTLFIKLSGLTEEMHSVVLANMSAIAGRSLTVVKSAFEKIRRVYVFIFAPISAALLSTSFFLIDVLAGPRYQEGAIPFAILCIVLFIVGVFVPHTTGVMAWTPPKKRFFVVLIQGVVMLGATVPLGLILGLSGIALAWVVAKLVDGLLSSYILRRSLPISFDRHAVRVVALPSILLLFVCGCGQLLFYHRLAVPIYLAIGIAVYTYIFVRRISQEDLQILEDILPLRLGWIVSLLRRYSSNRVATAS